MRKISGIHTCSSQKKEKDVLKTIEDYNPLENPLFQGAMPLRDVYGELPDFVELTVLIRSIYGDDFVQFIERSSQEPASLKIKSLLVQAEKAFCISTFSVNRSSSSEEWAIFSIRRDSCFIASAILSSSFC